MDKPAKMEKTIPRGQSALLISLYHHVALPLRLPGGHDRMMDEVNASLNNRLLEAVCVLLGRQWDHKSKRNLETIRKSLETCRDINIHGRLSKPALLHALSRLSPGSLIILHISQQNAGLIIRRPDDVNVIVEAFEAAAPCEEVMAAKNALQWDFPGSAQCIPYVEFSKPTFIENLASFLEQASTESIKQFAATTNKAGSNVIESRNTVDPSLICQLLMTILQANGASVATPKLRKRVRDDVCFHDAEIPWRRSPFWLVLRVSIQRQLGILFDDDGKGEIGRAIYKFMICYVLAELLKETFGHIYLESTDILRRKLCRRIAKLESDKEKAQPEVRKVYDFLFAALGGHLASIIDYTNERINTAWNSYKAASSNSIAQKLSDLPQMVQEADKTLSLKNCGPTLQGILAVPLRGNPNQNFKETESKSKFTNIFRNFAKRYFKLAELDDTALSQAATTAYDSQSDAGDLGISFYERDCLEYCREIRQYLTAVKDAYPNDAEQMSIVILNTISLWVSADEAAIRAFPLLRDFRPVIQPSMLDVLHLLHEEDLERLYTVQQYLSKRFSESTSKMTIYSEPARGCFAERYFEESEFAPMYKRLQERIDDTTDQNRKAKEQEWKRLSAEYEKLMQDIASSTCGTTKNRVFPFDVIHDDKKCQKCYNIRCAKRMRIDVHEDPLPSDGPRKKAVIFELSPPKAFAVYRSVTWMILRALALQPETGKKLGDPRILLYDYKGLAQYIDRKYDVSLASTKKSFLYSHWAKVTFPVALENVCLQNGLEFAYYDTEGKMWPGNWPHKPTFAHHCRLRIPSSSPFLFIMNEKHFEADMHGLTSNEVVASQTMCPPGINTLEFMAFQNLLSGKTRRWPSMLMELGSSNLNFSSEATGALYAYLAHQAGPPKTDDHFRVVHSIFKDEAFRERLTQQVLHRLEAIAGNCRETHCMELLLALALKLWALSPKSDIPTAVDELLDRARTILLQWLRSLRKEVYEATDVKTAERMGKYVFWTALLCRRTFLPYRKESIIGPYHLAILCESSIALQDNLPGNPNDFSQSLKNAVIRDLKLVHDMRNTIKNSILASPASIIMAISDIWPEAEGSEKRQFTNIRFLDKPDDYWVELEVAKTEVMRRQIVRYHILEGHLLIDGKPLGKLPSEYRQSPVLNELFGEQNLLTFPSGLPGMSYRLALNMSGNEVHLGFRGTSMIIRMRKNHIIYEHIDRSIFGTLNDFDLPADLVDKCVHWLDLKTGRLECRRKPKIWTSRESNWTLEVKRKICHRRQSMLVDPHSEVFKKIANLFTHFEYPRFLTLFQGGNTLNVLLKRLELQFFVNTKGLLESFQLGSEFDPNQDAGTWYGLRSKIVLRDTKNHQNRSIIVPMGSISIERSGIHNFVYLSNVGYYGRFAIDNTLGRITCPCEPWLLYKKAQIHAYTSFFLPDALTGRTGTEEALHILASGYCQPYDPLHGGSEDAISSIAKLTPRREYYPESLKYQQATFWNADLTEYMQHEAFRIVVDEIYRKSQQLSVFNLGATSDTKTEPKPLDSAGEMFLLERANYRRNLYTRPNCDPMWGKSVPDRVYESRDYLMDSQRNMRVFETVSTLRNWPSKIHCPRDIATMFQKWPNIGGFTRYFDKVLLTDKLQLDVPIEFGAMVCTCKLAKPEDAHKLMFLLGTLSFGFNDMNAIRLFLAFALFDELKTHIAPMHSVYSQFRQNQIPSVGPLAQMVKAYIKPLTEEPSSNVAYASFKQQRKSRNMQMRIEEDNDKAIDDLVHHLLKQWPCTVPNIENAPGAGRIKVESAFKVIAPEWLKMYQNYELSLYVQRIQLLLEARHTPQAYQKPAPVAREFKILPIRLKGRASPTLLDLIVKPAPTLSERHSPRKLDIRGSKFKLLNAQYCPREVVELQQIIHEFSFTESIIRKNYAESLSSSLQSLKQVTVTPFTATAISDAGQIYGEINEMKQNCANELDQIRAALRKGDSRAKWLNLGGLWPCTSSIEILEKLRTTLKVDFGSGMKEAFIKYATSVTMLQRHIRMYDAARKKQNERLGEEQKNTGHANWRPIEHPDWILLEIDSNILIREDQVNVALATISPASGENSVLQMNMGQGKTSCIMPMVAAELADGQTLARLIVPKALLFQTAQLLQSRLGGLLGREVRHVPFARRTPNNLETIKLYLKIHQEIMKKSGCIVTLPEHVLSFMLSGLQRLSDGQLQEAQKMIGIQGWIKKVSRDVLDECDYTIAVRTQLIYPGGTQMNVAGFPHRWEAAETLLKVVDGHLYNLKERFPRSIDVVKRKNGGFPVIHFLRKDVEDALLTRIVEDICCGRTSLLPLRDCTREEILLIKEFITSTKPSPNAAQRIDELFTDNRAAKENTYLLRGLLVHRILLMCLKKRWNVQYGLHPDRSPIAVPFYAKGIPSDQAEFGHPDVSIIFTVLAFYYAGLTMTQLSEALRHVLKSNDPASEYDRWCCGAETIPDNLREWNVINVDDEGQMTALWEHLRYAVTVIDYYLNHFVFPKHAKQFKTKLQASGWDIPLLNLEPAGSVKGVTQVSRSMTTGFSGTNDTRSLLPLTIKQADLPSLSHTNAEVLTYLLNPRNQRYFVASKQGKHLTEIELLEHIFRQKIRVLIDAGAHILEMDNKTLVEEWLKIDVQATAAVYFDKGKAWVTYRSDGSSIPLLASPFAEDMRDCLVYIDEGNVRGTDLKLPLVACGALTLAIGQTKDHTVQAAMRLRQLGTTQSVVFYAGPEVHQSILHYRRKGHNDKISSRDVVHWLLEQTCSANEQLQPLFFSQGADYCKRQQAALDNSRFLTSKRERENYLNVLRQREQQTLQRLYGVKTKVKTEVPNTTYCKEIQAFVKELNVMKKNFQDTGDAVHGSALQIVEQEREVENQVESVREIQKQIHYPPMRFQGTHKDILAFAHSGRLPVVSYGTTHVFHALKFTGLGLKYGVRVPLAANPFFVSNEFMQTIALSKGQTNDNFVRPVNWVLWSTVTSTAILIVPEEAEVLIPILSSAQHPLVHLLCYAAPVTRRMLHFNNLAFYAIPTLPVDWKAPNWLKIQLGIFAGRLYFDYDEYTDILKFLGLCGSEGTLEDFMAEIDAMSLAEAQDSSTGVDTTDDEYGKVVRAEGKATAKVDPHKFVSKPLTFLQEWLSVRRRGQDFAHTPMGYICQGKPLNSDHPFFGGVPIRNEIQTMEDMEQPDSPGDSHFGPPEDYVGMNFDDY